MTDMAGSVPYSWLTEVPTNLFVKRNSSAVRGGAVFTMSKVSDSADY